MAEGDRFLYGNQWGDPTHGRTRYLYERYIRRRKVPGDLGQVPPRFILPYVQPFSTVLEIGSGGGRWTQFLLRARRVIVVEHTEAFFPYLEHRFGPRFDFYKTLGDELAGIPDDSVDFVFSFGTLVHLPIEIVQAYVKETARVLRRDGVATLQYADKTKMKAQHAGAQDAGFSSSTGETFLAWTQAAGLTLMAHDTRLLNHSNIAVLRKP